MRKSDREHGFIMLWAVLIMVMLMIAVLVVIDINTATHGKIKIQSGVDAAALAGAKWQMESLNIIGELNLIKATSALLDTDSDGQTDSAISEMQTRISFVGPMTGMGAAQQAAKNNGVDYNPNVETLLLIQLGRLESAIYDRTEILINNYDWREPYQRMLYEIACDQPAVRVNSRISSIEHMTPSWLRDETLYWAILNANFCHPYLRRWFEDGDGGFPDDYWNGGWWQNVTVGEVAFPEESEYLSLGVEFMSANANHLAGSLNGELIAAAGIREIREEPIANFCIFDSTWNELPDVNWNIHWLRRPARESAWVGGALACAQAEQSFGLTMRYRPQSSTDNFDMLQQQHGGKKALQQYWRRFLPRRQSAEAPAQSVLRESPERTVRQKCIAVAKPFGELSNGERPDAAGIILPVFRDVALVPSSMYPSNDLRANRSMFLDLFLLWLADNGGLSADIATMTLPTTLPAECGIYLEALQRLCSNELTEKIAYYDENGQQVVEDVNLRNRIRFWLDINDCPDYHGTIPTWGPNL